MYLNEFSTTALIREMFIYCLIVPHCPPFGHLCGDVSHTVFTTYSASLSLSLKQLYYRLGGREALCGEKTITMWKNYVFVCLFLTVCSLMLL